MPPGNRQLVNGMARATGHWMARNQKTPPMEPSPNQVQHFRELGVAAIEKFIAADPFNGTYLRFEFELRALDGHPRFEQLVARFRDPQATANSPPAK
jgi:hypothetical protein